MSTTTIDPDLSAEPTSDPTPPAPPVLDVVVPVYNEEHVLRPSIERLHDYLSDGFPFSWRITVADNASTDHTAEVARRLAAELPNVRATHLDRKGRGLALRTAWSGSDADVVAYMDVDLSTGLDALLPLVAPLVSGHSDIAIGSRLAPGANVARGPKRETISRVYNLLLRTVFANRFRDAQCGFKAVRTDVARRLLPEVQDDGWFFDTELLLLAEHNGLRVHEVPVDWVDDPDSRVAVASTAIADLKGTARMAGRFARGGGTVDLGPLRRDPVADDLGRSLVTFGLIGVLSTLCTVVLFLVLRPGLGSVAAVAIALAATTFGNSWAHRRFSLRRLVDARAAGGVMSATADRHRSPGGLAGYAVVSTGLAVAGIGLSVGALLAVSATGGAVLAELLALTMAWTAVTVVRFLYLRRLAAPAATAGARR